MFIRTEYNYDMYTGSIESGLECRDPSLAKQSFAEEVDINTIVRRFNLTGQLPSGLAMPQYAHVDGIFDFHDAMNFIRETEEAFMAMPADIRARFHNDKAEFHDFLSDPRNLPEARKMGLVEPEPAPSTPQPSQSATQPGALPQATGGSGRVHVPGGRPDKVPGEGD